MCVCVCVKNFNYVFKSMFLRKNGRIGTHLQQLPYKNKPLLFIKVPPEAQQLLSPYLSIK